MADAEWKRIDSLVRPQRYALFINETLYWHHTCQRAIEIFTQLWGGAGFIIIPTDGNTISDKFWEILESYSPDYLGSYKTTLRDLRWADPEEYTSRTGRLRSEWISQGVGEEDADRTIREQDTNLHINELRLSDELKKELLDRLSPFHYARMVDRHNIFAASLPDFPFTQVKHILPHSKNKPAVVYKQKELSDPAFNLMAKMRSGAITEQFEADLESSGIAISDALSGVNDKDYLNVLERGQVDRLARVIAEGGSTIPEDFLSCLPNSLSLNGLGKYFKLEPYRQEQEYVTVVVGDKLEDFCFAFSLSKMLNNVHWLPDKPLQDAYRQIEQMRRIGNAGAEVPERDENTQIVQNLASAYIQKIGYGHHSEQKIVLTSISLSKRQLGSRLQKIQSLAYVGMTNPQTHTVIRSSDEVDVSYIGRLLETNNYVNEQAIAFVNNESVERMRSIKPKNFDYIDAQHHRWIQTIQVDGFQLPPLPSLANEVLKNASSRYEVRVGKDGVAYLLPGIAYFAGNDIDTTLSRPELKLLTSAEIFAHYFAAHYVVFPSDKGKYFDDTVEKFGSLDEAAKFFGNKKYNKLFGQFTGNRRADEGRRRNERIFLEYSSRAYMDIKAIRKALGHGSNAGNLIDYLLSIQVIRRGLILLCNKCACSAWYDNDGIGQEFECVRCRTRQLILKQSWKQPDEPSWYYSLAETVQQFYKSNSHITLLALRYIKGDSRNFLYLPEVELRELRDNGDKLEIDIACIKDGKIYLGEAKNRKLASADLTKYINLDNLLTPKPHRLVFASDYTSVPQGVRTRIKSAGVESRTFFVLHEDLFGRS